MLAFLFVRSTKCANKPARLSYSTSRCEHKVLCCRYICTNIGVVFFKAPRRQDHQAVRPVSISAFSWLYVFLCEVSVWFFLFVQILTLPIIFFFWLFDIKSCLVAGFSLRLFIFQRIFWVLIVWIVTSSYFYSFVCWSYFTTFVYWQVYLQHNMQLNKGGQNWRSTFCIVRIIEKKFTINKLIHIY